MEPGHLSSTPCLSKAQMSGLSDRAREQSSSKPEGGTSLSLCAFIPNPQRVIYGEGLLRADLYIL